MVRTTGPLLKVLRALVNEPTGELYGLDLLRATGLKSGTLYPLLARLEAEGWVSRRWEEIQPTEEGRPRRRFYSLTALGSHEARQLLVEYGVGVAHAWT
jgi:PadR family transcriptional regulator PadR